ncbi:MULTISPECIES: hypothetical protein [unclassified Ruegeria]|uniref:hypothetical protein n=1 Tax=unclassified Ruegeria TaxID=2625375 RepID=UPI0014920C83|nr:MULTISPECIES: hypothetical protein [unclassified Ruegeria]NOD35689.1 hypothetical protein [Ruegeria sp. HKCCD7296]NOE43056.1 hypothetical protein [Ruegeria sp. HKCCD7319]
MGVSQKGIGTLADQLFTALDEVETVANATRYPQLLDCVEGLKTSVEFTCSALTDLADGEDGSGEPVPLYHVPM